MKRNFDDLMARLYVLVLCISVVLSLVCFSLILQTRDRLTIDEEYIAINLQRTWELQRTQFINALKPHYQWGPRPESRCDGSSSFTRCQKGLE